MQSASLQLQRQHAGGRQVHARETQAASEHRGKSPKLLLFNFDLLCAVRIYFCGVCGILFIALDIIDWIQILATFVK